MNSLTYPEPKFRWNQEVPDNFIDADGQQSGKPEKSFTKAVGELTISIDSLQAVRAPSKGAGPHRYALSAGYYGEPPEMVQARRSQPMQAMSNPSDRTLDDCKVDWKLGIPYNPKQQIVKVFVHEVPPAGPEMLVGEATIAVADPSAENRCPYPISRDFDAYGNVLLSIALPDDEEDDEPTAVPALAPQLPVQHQRQQQAATSVSDLPPAVLAGCKLGAKVEVYTSAGKWLQGSVVKIEGTEVTVDCGDKLRAVKCEANNAQNYFRRVCVVGDIVEGFSKTNSAWVKATVTAVNGRQALYWIRCLDPWHWRGVTIEYEGIGRGRVIDLNDASLFDHFRFL